MQVEKEVLARTWVAENLECSLRGLDFQFETDHRALATLLEKSLIDGLPPRIQSFRVTLMRISFTVAYVPGKKIITAEALSRVPCNKISLIHGRLSANEVSNFVEGIMGEVQSSDLDKVRLAQQSDPLCQQLLFTAYSLPRCANVMSGSYIFCPTEHTLQNVKECISMNLA